MKAEATQALDAQDELNCPGFESSRVFALSAQLLANPPAGFPSRKRLLRSLQSVYLFSIQPSTAIDPSNPRTKPVQGNASTSGGALRPALWFADMKNKGVIGRGQPPKTVLGRKRKADVVIECRDRDFVDLATGKVQAQRLYNEGRVSACRCSLFAVRCPLSALRYSVVHQTSKANASIFVTIRWLTVDSRHFFCPYCRSRSRVTSIAHFESLRSSRTSVPRSTELPLLHQTPRPRSQPSNISARETMLVIPTTALVLPLRSPIAQGFEFGMLSTALYTTALVPPSIKPLSLNDLSAIVVALGRSCIACCVG